MILGSERLLASNRLNGLRVGLVCNPASIDGEFRHVVDRIAPRGRRAGRRDFRPAARVPIGPAGEHDRVAARATTRRGACRSIRSTARRASRRRRCCRARRAGHRPAGRRHAHLHLHLHDGQLPAAPAQRRPAGHRLRSAESDRRRRRRRADARAGFESFVGQFPIPMRHGMTIGELARLFNEHFGIGAEARGRDDAGLVARAVLRRHRPAVGAAVAEHPDGRYARSCIRARCCSKARTSRKGAARRGRSSSSARRGSTAEPFATAMNALGLAGRALPAGDLRADVPQTRARCPAAAARFTSPIATRSARSRPARR